MVRNSTPVTIKPSNNAKVISLSLKYPRWIVIHSIPTNEIFHELDIKTVKKMHSSFMAEGKLTIVLEDLKIRVVPSSLGESMDTTPFRELEKKVFVSGASPASLELFVKTVGEWQRRPKKEEQRPTQGQTSKPLSTEHKQAERKQQTDTKQSRK